mmetsp:Transcript_3502/g.10982  ORF Transcript_3502/g.10982 Transcript_3502/m.10982 type:complete len:367 (+) Transcript_3502:551-1651(+)
MISGVIVLLNGRLLQVEARWSLPQDLARDGVAVQGRHRVLVRLVDPGLGVGGHCSLSLATPRRRAAGLARRPKVADAHALEELVVLPQVAVGVVDPERQVPSEDVREAVPEEPVVRQHRVGLAVAGPRVHVAEVPGGALVDEPAAQGDGLGPLHLHGLDHRREVARGVEVVVVEVGDVVARGQMRAHVALQAYGEVLVLPHPVGDVHDALVLLGLLDEERRVRLRDCIHYDQLLVRPRLCVEDQPQLFMEGVPGLCCRAYDRDSARAEVGWNLDLRAPVLRGSGGGVEAPLAGEEKAQLPLVPGPGLGREAHLEPPGGVALGVPSRNRLALHLVGVDRAAASSARGLSDAPVQVELLGEEQAEVQA